MDQPQNIVQRLQSRLDEVRSLGFDIRWEVLEDEQAGWCVLAGVPTLFLDLGQTAGDQLRHVDEILAAYQNELASGPVETGQQRAA